MNDASLFDDLKQFIDTRLSQTETVLCNEFDKKLSHTEQVLRDEMQDGFAGVGEAIEQLHTRVDASEEATNRRLANLEQQAA